MHSTQKLHLDPHKVNADPKHCEKQLFAIKCVVPPESNNDQYKQTLKRDGVGCFAEGARRCLVGYALNRLN
jgi:hypothetical protein